MSRTVLGVDQATHTGFAVIDEQGNIISSGTKAFSTKLGERLNQFEAWFRDMLITYAPAMVVYEKPHFRGYDSTVSCVGLVVEMLKGAAATGTPLNGVHTATLKSFATGSGKATKEEMTEAANKAAGVNLSAASNNDEADAIHLARYGWEVLMKGDVCRRKKK